MNRICLISISLTGKIEMDSPILFFLVLLTNKVRKLNEVTMNTKVGILCLYLFQILVGCSVSESPYEKYDLTSLTEKCRNENKYLVIIIGMEDCRFCNFFYHVLRASGTLMKDH